MAKKDKKGAVEETQEVTDSAAPQQPTESQEGLQLTDLTIMMQILDVVTTRGAIKADEMATVGALYGKLKTFIEQTTQAAPEAPATEEADSTKD
jgi:hypothetical protein